RVDPRRVVKNAPAVLPKKVEGVFVVDDRVGEHGERFSGLAVVAHDNDLGVTCGQVGFGGDDVGGELGVHLVSPSAVFPADKEDITPPHETLRNTMRQVGTDITRTE